MARGAAQARRKRTKAEARRRRRRMQSDAPVRVASQTMFFPRLRRQAKWVFVFLALVFAVGFVVFGVGSGGGVGLGDLFDNNSGGNGGVSEKSARKRIEKNPKDAQAYQDLAAALQTNGNFTGAVTALKKLTELQPRNVDGLTTLAGLYTTLGSRLQPQIQNAQTGPSSLLTAFNPGLTLGKQLVVPPNPIFDAVSRTSNNRLTKLYTQQQDDFALAEKIYKRIAKLEPRDAPTQLNLGQSAQQAGDTSTAIAAYERFIRLAPDDPTTAIVKQQIKALQKASTQQVSGG